jgi:hypothetical protein
MPDIPAFKNLEDESLYDDIFKRKLDQFYCLAHLVKDEFFPGYKWEGLQPATVKLLFDLTDSLSYDAMQEFKTTIDGYEEEDDKLFVPRHSLKENLKQAMEEISQETMEKNNTEPQ